MPPRRNHSRLHCTLCSFDLWSIRHSAAAALARIFSVLAVLAVLLLAANFLVGLWVGDFNAAAQDKRAAAEADDRTAERAAASWPADDLARVRSGSPRACRGRRAVSDARAAG